MNDQDTQEKQDAGQKRHRAEYRDLDGGLLGGTDEIGTQQNADIGRHHEIVVFELAVVVGLGGHELRSVARRRANLPTICNTDCTAGAHCRVLAKTSHQGARRYGRYTDIHLE